MKTALWTGTLVEAFDAPEEIEERLRVEPGLESLFEEPVEFEFELTVVTEVIEPWDPMEPMLAE